MQNTPYQVRFKFGKLHSKSEKKNLSVYNFFYFSLQNRTAFGERIPKRYNTWGLESYFMFWVGVARRWAGGCGWRRVPDYMTPSVIPFWNRLTKCSLILKRKVKKLTNWKIFFSDLLCNLQNSQVGGGILHGKKILFLNVVCICLNYQERNPHPPSSKSNFYITCYINVIPGHVCGRGEAGLGSGQQPEL